ncbi:MAG: 4'-phosphopantetheinyl transferase superfamily protein, partial [Bifidobacteriaceae bacterium]|nr:4'-phosphopantetheinyl transferase superfamily protein [Bifidobacteriaceae bacterium]
PDERAHIEAAAEEDASRRFLEIWTKKEAYLKWRGTGLAGGLESFSVLAPEPFGVVFHPVTLPGDERFVGHVCAAP